MACVQIRHEPNQIREVQSLAGEQQSSRPAQCRESCSANQCAAAENRRSIRRGGSFRSVHRCRLHRITVSSIDLANPAVKRLQRKDVQLRWT